MTSRSLVTADGMTLAADLIVPTSAPVRAGAVVCHPHPLYGGDRSHPMVVELCDALVLAGVTALRFDFRSDHGGGVTERLDVQAALDELSGSPGLEVGRPSVVAGYSFGAVVGLTTDDPRITAVVSIAGPLTPRVPPPTVPTLLVVPRHDQYGPPERIEPIAASWRDAGSTVDVVVVESCDHFLAGAIHRIASIATDWISAQIG